MSPRERLGKKNVCPLGKLVRFVGLLFFILTPSSLFSWTAEALAQQVTQENLDKGLIYPPFSNIRKISAHIAANVAAKAYELGELLPQELFVAYLFRFCTAS